MHILRYAAVAALGAASVGMAAACSSNPSIQESTTTTSSSSGSGAGGSNPASSSSTGGAMASSSSSSSSGTGGAGTPFKPGAQPQVVTFGGVTLTGPKVQPIAYASDPDEKSLEAFLQELASTSYWGQVTSEYGVGALTVLPTIVLNTTAPTSLMGSDVEQMLSDNLTGASPAWGAPDPSTIYLFLFPHGTIVDDDGNCCTDFDGYHYEAQVGSGSVPYAVTCACPGFDGPGITSIEQRTVVVSHELVEAATDPFVNSNPAYAQTDDPDLVWSIVTGGEVADMCSYNLDSYFIPPGSTYMVQRSWSNAAAKKLTNPCLPVPASAPPYFSSFPALTDAVHFNGGFGSVKTTGVKIPIGQSKTIDVHLWSAAPTAKAWKVTAYDYSEFVNGGAPNLKFSWDKTTGQSGDTLKLTITVMSADPSLSAEAFLLTSDLGSTETITMGMVGQN